MASPRLSPDAEDFIRLLNVHGVEYVIIGGWAVIGYGYSRLTGDYDFFCRKSFENASRLYAALEEFFGTKPPGLAGPDDFLESDWIRYGEPPNRIEISNNIAGVEFDDAIKGAPDFPLADCRMISLDSLIKNKRTVGRHKDLDDVENLEKIREARKKASCGIR